MTCWAGTQSSLTTRGCNNMASESLEWSSTARFVHRELLHEWEAARGRTVLYFAFAWAKHCASNFSLQDWWQLHPTSFPHPSIPRRKIDDFFRTFLSRKESTSSSPLPPSAPEPAPLPGPASSQSIQRDARSDGRQEVGDRAIPGRIKWLSVNPSPRAKSEATTITQVMVLMMEIDGPLLLFC